MKRAGVPIATFLLALCLPLAASAGHTVVHRGPHGRTVVHKGPRGRVVVHHGFPIARALPDVYVRAPHVRVRVAPRVYLHPVVFPAVVVKVRPAPRTIVWHSVEPFAVDDGWTDVSLAIAQRGTQLYFELGDAPARVSFAEVVYADGTTQVVDFDDKVYEPGFYSLVAFDAARDVDHVRLVASATTGEVHVGFHLAL